MEDDVKKIECPAAITSCSRVVSFSFKNEL